MDNFTFNFRAVPIQDDATGSEVAISNTGYNDDDDNDGLGVKFAVTELIVMRGSGMTVKIEITHTGITFTVILSASYVIETEEEMVIMLQQNLDGILERLSQEEVLTLLIQLLELERLYISVQLSEGRLRRVRGLVAGFIIRELVHMRVAVRLDELSLEDLVALLPTLWALRAVEQLLPEGLLAGLLRLVLENLWVTVSTTLWKDELSLEALLALYSWLVEMQPDIVLLPEEVSLEGLLEFVRQCIIRILSGITEVQESVWYLSLTYLEGAYVGILALEHSTIQLLEVPSPEVLLRDLLELVQKQLQSVTQELYNLCPTSDDDELLRREPDLQSALPVEISRLLEMRALVEQRIEQESDNDGRGLVILCEALRLDQLDLQVLLVLLEEALLLRDEEEIPENPPEAESMNTDLADVEQQYPQLHINPVSESAHRVRIKVLGPAIAKDTEPNDVDLRNNEGEVEGVCNNVVGILNTDATDS